MENNEDHERAAREVSEDDYFKALIERAKIGPLDISDLQIKAKIKESCEEAIKKGLLTNNDYYRIKSIINKDHLLSFCMSCSGAISSKDNRISLINTTSRPVTQRRLGHLCIKCGTNLIRVLKISDKPSVREFRRFP